MLSDKSIRAAMLDSLLQQDMQKEQFIIERIKDQHKKITKMQIELKKLCAELLTIQKQRSALTDALTLELCE